MIKDMSYEEYMKIVQQSTGLSKDCPVCKSLKLFSSKWRLAAIYELSKKPSYRFGELKKALRTITNTMLTATLRDLEEMDIVNRVQLTKFHFMLNIH